MQAANSEGALNAAPEERRSAAGSRLWAEETETQVSSHKDSSQASGLSSNLGDHTKIIVGRSALPGQITVSTLMDCPADESGNLLSLGSSQHDSGNCTPCKFTRSARGCKDGVLCKLCHADHYDLTRSGVRRAARFRGLQKRAIFDQPGAMAQALSKQVKNTFIDVGSPGPFDSDEALRAGRRARSSEPRPDSS
jgi:hypothetical protein